MNQLIDKYFQHYKGKFYYVLNISTHTETNEKLVNHVNLYDPISCWYRSLIMWNESVDGIPRFTEIVPTS